MKVFKFGGASVNSIERIKNLGDIVRQFPDEKILVVVSAMGKTTNALEKVVDAFYQDRKEDALKLFEQVKQRPLFLIDAEAHGPEQEEWPPMQHFATASWRRDRSSPCRCRRH